MTAPAGGATAMGGLVWDKSASQPARWGGSLAMALFFFALIASEFMPVSLLSPMARDLGVSEGFAGLGIAISGAFAVLTSLSISVMAGSMNRKTLLLALTALMAVSGLVVALASNYAVYMIGRALIGVVIGTFMKWDFYRTLVGIPILMVAVIQLAIALGSSVGGLLFDAIGYKSSFVASAAVLLIAAFLALLTARSPMPRVAKPHADQGDMSYP